ncbi:MAG: spore coat protein CotJB [Bacillota bacterium]|uniref:spore coat protein CotJB n=1 Tax=Desulfurispora thermophila TaxID=265470 RepID=UPI00036984E6|nr:spore coat protein CotJB [Desulfurispora thermophila]
MSNNSEKMALLRKIMELDFAVLEATLFLDTHPMDAAALAYHQEYSKQLKELKITYSQQYGPLVSDSPDAATSEWRWLAQPWPWEL